MRVKLEKYLENFKYWYTHTNFKQIFIQKVKEPLSWIIFLAYIIPIFFFSYILYLNLLPFGLEKTYLIEVGNETDTSPSEFYLEPSENLSTKKNTNFGNTYRELSGNANIIFKPKENIKNSKIEIKIDGDSIVVIPKEIDFNYKEINWDNYFDFSEKLPSDFTGQSYIFDEYLYFDGKSQTSINNTQDKFEKRPFTVFIEWQPDDPDNNLQEVIGHFDWELVQNKETISFQVGRMNNATGTIRTIWYPIENDFFYKKHTAVAIYSPSSTEDENGYIELYVDNINAGRVYIGNDVIWGDYGNQNITLGKAAHNYGKNPYFKGRVFKVGLAEKNFSSDNSSFTFFNKTLQELTFTVHSFSTSTLYKVILNVSKI